jgi:hypothetical protein
MNYEQDDPFPTLLRDGVRVSFPPLERSDEDTAIRDRVYARIYGSNRTALGRLLPGHFDTAQDEKITAALARASARGVIPKMQPLAVFLESQEPRVDVTRKWRRSGEYYPGTPV